MNKKVLRNLSYGVYAVSALGENRMSGCITRCPNWANTFDR